MTRLFAILTSGIVLTACAAPPASEQSGAASDVQDYAKAVLNSLAAPSFTQGIEFCGYIFEGADGALAHTVKSGGVDFCDYGPAPGTTVASYHTHGDYAVGYDSEIPSVDDVEGSVGIGFDDYLGTPGGRFWINRADGVAQLICGAGCLESDPDYVPDPTLPVDNRYTLSDLRALFS